MCHEVMVQSLNNCASVIVAAIGLKAPMTLTLVDGKRLASGKVNTLILTLIFFHVNFMRRLGSSVLSDASLCLCLFVLLKLDIY